jgi:hypothetical protein
MHTITNSKAEHERLAAGSYASDIKCHAAGAAKSERGGGREVCGSGSCTIFPLEYGNQIMPQIDLTPSDTSEAEKCARLNDDCRWMRGDHNNFRHVVTRGVSHLISANNLRDQILRRAQLAAAVRSYDFKSGDGEERDFGCFMFLGEKLFFKIDAYDRNVEYGSPDPTDASVTIRVMTIMLASEY